MRISDWSSDVCSSDLHDVGQYAVLLVSIERPGPADTALHFVQDQHQVMLVAQLAQALQEFIGGNADAALALDRFDEETRGIRADRRLCGFEVIEFHVFEARQQRVEALVHLFLARLTYVRKSTRLNT